MRSCTFSELFVIRLFLLQKVRSIHHTMLSGWKMS
jgi:hypothetical protein